MIAGIGVTSEIEDRRNGVPTSQQYRDLIRPNGAIRLTDEVPAYARFDVGVGWRHPDNRISIDAFIDNVFNTAYATTIISSPSLNLRFVNPPRVAARARPRRPMMCPGVRRGGPPRHPG